MAKRPVRIQLETTTAPAPVVETFDPAAMNADTIRAIREFVTAKVKTDDNTPYFTQQPDTAIWTWYSNARQQYPTADKAEWFKSTAQRIIDADTAPTPESVGVVDDDKPLDKASQFIVDTLNADATFVAFTAQYLEAKEIVGSVLQQYTVRLLSDFATIGNTPYTLGAVGKFSCPSLDALPDPGSKEPSEKDRKAGKFGEDGNGNPYSARPANGWDIEWKYVAGKMQQVSRYREIVRRWPEGQRIKRDIAECNEGIANRGPYKDNSATMLAERIDYLSGQVATLARNLRDAVALIRQMQAINAMTKLSCHLVTYETVKPDKSTIIEWTIDPKKLRVRETRDGGNDERYTIADFLKLRPALVGVDATIGELRTSANETAEEKAEREKREAMAGQGATTKTDVSGVTAINYAVISEMFGKFLKENITIVQRDMNHPDTTKSDAALFALADIYISLNAMFSSHPDYVKRADDGMQQAGKFLAEFGMGAKQQKPELVAAVQQGAAAPLPNPNTGKPKLSI